MLSLWKQYRDLLPKVMPDYIHKLSVILLEMHKYLPSRSNLSSLLASRLSFRSCRSISWLILFCSLASSDMQHSMFPQSGGPQSVLTRGALSLRQAFQPRHTTPKNHISFTRTVSRRRRPKPQLNTTIAHYITYRSVDARTIIRTINYQILKPTIRSLGVVTYVRSYTYTLLSTADINTSKSVYIRAWNLVKRSHNLVNVTRFKKPMAIPHTCVLIRLKL